MIIPRAGGNSRVFSVFYVSCGCLWWWVKGFRIDVFFENVGIERELRVETNGFFATALDFVIEKKVVVWGGISGVCLDL